MEERQELLSRLGADLHAVEAQKNEPVSEPSRRPLWMAWLLVIAWIWGTRELWATHHVVVILGWIAIAVIEVVVSVHYNHAKERHEKATA